MGHALSAGAGQSGSHLNRTSAANLTVTGVEITLRPIRVLAGRAIKNIESFCTSVGPFQRNHY